MFRTIIKAKYELTFFLRGVMFKFSEKCALNALKSNNISEFPIPIYAIEQIIIDHDFDIVIIPTLRKSCVFDQTLFVANLPDAEFLISLAQTQGTQGDGSGPVKKSHFGTDF